jgi:eukaryotic-like serine/threonine-protein kinase
MNDGRDEPGDLVGTVLAGRYRVVRRLGVGAMGAVYLGEHMRIGRKDAIKILRASMARDPEAIARFTRGARNVSRIRHPNVCTLYDFGDTEEGYHFLAMEYVEGPTLGTLLQEEGPLPPERAIPLVAQVAEALQAAHALGIVHRDLKPDNIMVARETDGRERVKVVDFDIARGPAEEEGPAVTRHGFVVGTPEYMSPEQLTGDPLDGRSDVYSLALVLFRALAGRLPFEGDTAQEIMVQRLTRDPMTLAQAAGRAFPPALEEAIAAGLRRKAEERPPDARSFAAAVMGAVPGAASAGPPSSEVGATGAFPGGSGGVEGGATGGSPEAAAGPAPAGAAVPLTPSGGIPATRVSEASAPADGGGMNRKALLVGGGGAALLVTAAVVGVAVWLGGGPPGDGESPTAPVAGAEEGDAGFPAGGGEGDTAPGAEGLARADPDPPGAGAAGAEPPGGDPGGADAGGAGAQQGADPPGGDPGLPPTGAGAGATPSPGTGATGGVRLDVEPGEIRDLLFRQFVRQDENPSRSSLEAARDTAMAVWELDGAPVEERAFAAHVLGLALIPLGDSVRGVGWLEEAARLDPIERYILVRDAHRGGGGR